MSFQSNSPPIAGFSSETGTQTVCTAKSPCVGTGRSIRGALRLTLEKAVDLALKTHPALKATQAEVDGAREKRRQVKAAL